MHDLERPGAGPAERLGREPVPGLLPPAPAVVQAALPQAARALADRRRRRRAGSRAPRRRSTPTADARDRDARGRRAARAARAPAPAGSAGTTPPRTPLPRRARTRARTRRRRSRARCAAGRPARSRAAGARSPHTTAAGTPPLTSAARLSNRSRVSANQTRERHERREHAPARVREHERDQERIQPDDRARANEPRVPPTRSRPQSDRQPEDHDQRERVPVPDRRAEPSQPPVVRVQRGHGLPGQGPEARGDDERRRAATRRPGCESAEPTNAPTTANAKYASPRLK